MIGWERRVLLKHYLEQGFSQTEIARRDSLHDSLSPFTERTIM